MRRLHDPAPGDPYARIAPWYDAVTSAFLRGPRERMAETCAALGARRILDMGCGTGRFLDFLPQGSAEPAVGLDISPAMLARRPARAHVFFVAADGTLPPFAPGSFDLVICCLLLHESGERDQDLLAASFALAPKVLVLEWRMPERNLDYARAFWVHGIERLAGREHYKNFRRFMRLGGLNGLVQRSAARLLTETPLAGGSLVLALLGAPRAQAQRTSPVHAGGNGLTSEMF